MIFKDRDKYVSGEFRFRNGYCRGNPRKMVQTWAEKEMRNLLRLQAGGVRVPEPVLLRGHLLLMEFIGEDGWPAPKLKDVDLSTDVRHASELYRECALAMRRMYQQCHLVHADLSEFNILYHSGALCFIDVSQSVEHDHPRSLVFLRADCANITAFFRKFGVPTLRVRRLFDFITDTDLSECDADARFDEALHMSKDDREDDDEDDVDEKVFKNAYIPQRLDEVPNYERDAKSVKTAEADELLYARFVGMKPDMSGPIERSDFAGDETVEKAIRSSGAESDDSEAVDDEAAEKAQSSPPKYYRPLHETSEERRERKNLVKEEQREKRKNKTPKHVKKRRDTLSKRK